jgi:5-methylcytosine-specific restriction endonuclease McrA
MNPRYPLVARRAGYHCEYCHAPEVIFNFPFEIEHIIPASQGGDDEETNLALACRSCNLRKANHRSGIDPLSESAVRLYDPRQDRWEEHFNILTEIGMIEGLTDIGRTTIWRLQINAPAQLAARSLWIRLGLL